MSGDARHLASLTTELVNPACAHIDELDTLAALRVMNEQDATVATAVASVLPEVAGLVDATVERMLGGGRLFNVGAGTSGRMGMLDASECPPTFGVSPEMVQGVLAGGDGAFRSAAEEAEDDAEAGEEDLARRGVCERDVVVGIAASGRTPYVVGALDYARKAGALTGAISCVADAELSSHVAYPIECVTGPEAICGSTRLKAGTAQKMLLNMISTEVMVKLGKVYGNLMVGIQPTNEKLVMRARRIVALATECSAGRAAEALEASGQDVKVAICMVLLDASADACRDELLAHGGNVAAAIRALKGCS